MPWSRSSMTGRDGDQIAAQHPETDLVYEHDPRLDARADTLWAEDAAAPHPPSSAASSSTLRPSTSPYSLRKLAGSGGESNEQFGVVCASVPGRSLARPLVLTG